MTGAEGPVRAEDDLDATLAAISALVELKNARRRLTELRSGLVPQPRRQKSLRQLRSEIAAVRAEADRLELEQRESS